MRMLMLVVALALTGGAAAQCPNQAGPAAQVIVTVHPPAQSMPVVVMPAARVEYRLVALPPARTATVVGDCAPAAAYQAPAVEYRYGPLGRLRKVVVR